MGHEYTDENYFLLKDSEIEKAIMDGAICLAYQRDVLGEKKNQFIQPASLDFIVFKEDKLLNPSPIIHYAIPSLKWYDSQIFLPVPVLRSTFRRKGVYIAGNGLMREQNGEYKFGISNCSNEPIIIQKNERVVQILWFERGGHNYGTGQIVRDARGKSIFAKGDVDKEWIDFHKHKSEPDKIIGRYVKEEGESWNLWDMPCEERISIGGNFGILAHFFDSSYLPYSEYNDWQILGHFISYGNAGWIDPGYGSSSENGLTFSFQKSTREGYRRLKPGDVLGSGLLIEFPEPVSLRYGEERGSNYG